MAGYKYKGTPKPAPKPITLTGTYDPAYCGKRTGYKRHLRLGIPVCSECLAANREYNRNIVRNPDGTKKITAAPMDTSKCGTRAGLSAHKRRGQTPCRPCKDAYNVYYRERRAAS